MKENPAERCYSYGLLGRCVVTGLLVSPLILVGVTVTLLLRGDIILVVNLLQLGVFLLVIPAVYFLYPVEFCLTDDRLEVHYLFAGRARFSRRDLRVQRGLGGALRIRVTSGGWKTRVVGSFRVATAWVVRGEELLNILTAIPGSLLDDPPSGGAGDGEPGRDGHPPPA